jgi:hypothetical protein
VAGGPSARFVEDLNLALPIIAGPDGQDVAIVPVPLGDPQAVALKKLRVAFHTDNGILSPTPETAMVVKTSARALADTGMAVEEARPPGIDQGYEILIGLFGADSGTGLRMLLQSLGTYVNATEKFAPQVEISEDGAEIFNYVAGAPFPNIDINNDPLAGFKIMWNHEQSPAMIDNLGTDFIGEMINNKGEVVRTYATSWRRMMWVGRLYTDPKPVVPHNPPVRHSNLFGPTIEPEEYKGAALLYFRYLPRDMPDDTYVYVPEYRRVIRITEANRSDALFGTDFDVDSFYGFNGNLRHWTFLALAEKEILVVVHSGKYGERSAWCAPRDGQHGILAALPCVSWEKRRVWVIEATPTAYPRDYAFSKRILYIDQDFFLPVLQEMYDQRGELWKAMLVCIYYAKKPYDGYPARPLEGGTYHYEEEWPFVPNWVLLDLQRSQATTGEAPSGYKQPAEWWNEWYFNENVPSNTAEVYSPNYLIRSAR